MYKCVEVRIPARDLSTLKQNNYNLCFAKKVNGGYSVICSASDDYMENNKFSWVPMYSVFGSNGCQESRPVKMATNMVDINMGDSTILTPYGMLSRAISGRGGSALNIINEYGDIHFGVCQVVTSIDGSQVMRPIYVSPSPYEPGGVSMRPGEEVMVWFEQGASGGIVFSGSKSGAFEVDLRYRDSAKIEYVDGRWQSV